MLLDLCLRKLVKAGIFFPAWKLLPELQKRLAEEEIRDLCGDRVSRILKKEAISRYSRSGRRVVGLTAVVREKFYHSLSYGHWSRSFMSVIRSVYWVLAVAGNAREEAKVNVEEITFLKIELGREKCNLCRCLRCWPKTRFTLVGVL